MQAVFPQVIMTLAVNYSRRGINSVDYLSCYERHSCKDLEMLFIIRVQLNCPTTLLLIGFDVSLNSPKNRPVSNRRANIILTSKRFPPAVRKKIIAK